MTKTESDAKHDVDWKQVQFKLCFEGDGGGSGGVGIQRNKKTSHVNDYGTKGELCPGLQCFAVLLWYDRRRTT